MMGMIEEEGVIGWWSDVGRTIQARVLWNVCNLLLLIAWSNVGQR